MRVRSTLLATLLVGWLLGVVSTLITSVVTGGDLPNRILPGSAASKLVGKWQCTTGDCLPLFPSMEFLSDGTFVDELRGAHRYTVVDGKKIKFEFRRSDGSVRTIVYDFSFGDDGGLRIDFGSRVAIFRRVG